MTTETMTTETLCVRLRQAADAIYDDDEVSVELLRALAEAIDGDLVLRAELKAQGLRAGAEEDPTLLERAQAIELGAQAARRIWTAGRAAVRPRGPCGMRYHDPGCNCGGMGGDR